MLLDNTFVLFITFVMLDLFWYIYIDDPYDPLLRRLLLNRHPIGLIDFWIDCIAAAVNFLARLFGRPQGFAEPEQQRLLAEPDPQIRRVRRLLRVYRVRRIRLRRRRPQRA